MDPLSIAAAAATLSHVFVQASSALFTYFAERGNVDTTIEDLAVDVKQTGEALKQISTVLKSPYVIISKIQTSEENSELWRAIQDAVNECNDTKRLLDTAVQPFNQRAGNLAARKIRQLKLSLAKKNIISLRRRNRLNLDHLKLILHLLDITECAMNRDRIIAELGSKNQQLQESLDHVRASQDEQSEEISQLSATMKQNTEKLLSIAERILSRSSELYESTVADKSDDGAAIAAETRNRANSMIPELGNNGILVSHSTDSCENVTDSFGHNHTEDTSFTDDKEPQNEDTRTHFDKREIFNLQFTKTLLDKGEKFLAEENYVRAEIFLQKGVQKFNELPYGLREKLDTEGVPLMIATCKFNLGKLDEAEADLLELVGEEAKDDQHANRLCQMKFILAQIYLINGQLDKAALRANECFNGLLELFNEPQRDYYRSLGLLSEISSAGGDDASADAYYDQIPADIASQLKKTRTQEHLSKTPGISSVESPFHLASGSSNGDLKLWDLQKGLLWSELKLDRRPISRAAFAPNFQSVVFEFYRFLDVFDLTKVVSAGQLQLYEQGRALAISADGQLVALGCHDRDVQIWNLPSTVGTIHSSHFGFAWSKVIAIQISQDNRFVASASENGKVRIWNLQTKTERAHFDSKGSVTVLAFSPDSNFVASGSTESSTNIWSLTHPSSHFRHRLTNVHAMAFSSDNKYLALGQSDGTITVLHIRKDQAPEIAHSINGHAAPVVALAFSTDALLLASGSEDQSLKVWVWKEGNDRGKQRAQYHNGADSLSAIGFVSKELWSKASRVKSS